MPRLYEIIAFCPAFNANRTGEIRSERRSARPSCLKLAWALAGGKRPAGSHLKARRWRQSVKICLPPSKVSQLLATGTVSTSGYRLRNAFVAQESPAWANHLAGSANTRPCDSCRGVGTKHKPSSCNSVCSLLQTPRCWSSFQDIKMLIFEIQPWTCCETHRNELLSPPASSICVFMQRVKTFSFPASASDSCFRGC